MLIWHSPCPSYYDSGDLYPSEGDREIIETAIDGVPDRVREVGLVRFRAYGICILIVVSTVLFSSVVLSQEIKKKNVQRRNKTLSTPLQVFKGIERAWRNRDAEALSKYTGASRVFLNVRGMERADGYFSKPQFYFLFKKYYKANKHQRFIFVKYHNLERPDRKVYGIASRSYKNVRSGRLFQDKVYVTLKREGERWVLAEIKSTW